MYCKKCGKKLDENSKFCSACGEPASHTYIDQMNNANQDITSNPYILSRDQPYNSNQNGKNYIPDQPTKALVVEGIGILFFIYMFIVSGSSDYTTQIWFQEYGGGVFLIGLIFLVISFFMFKKHKKNHKLYGIGYIAYIISCIAVILIAVILILSILMIIITIIPTKLH